MDYNNKELKYKYTLILCFITMVVTCIVIFAIQFYRAINIDIPDPEPVDNIIEIGIKSADEELIFTEEHQKEVETVVRYIPIETYKKIQSLPPDDLVNRAMERVGKFSTTIRSDNFKTPSEYSADDPRSGPTSRGILP